MGPAASLLELEGITKEYEGEPEPTRVLRGIDLRVESGESLSIVGPSGCGKSTLLNLIAALDLPTSGGIRFKGGNLRALTAADAARFRNREIGFVLQQHHLLPQCTAFENVLVPTLVNPDSKEASVRARALLERVGLGDRLDRRPAQLSGGERQRVAVVRALINGPSLLLADEPTGALNEEASDELADLLLELNAEQGMALIVVTHAPRVASKMSRVLELHNGILRPKEPAGCPG